MKIIARILVAAFALVAATTYAAEPVKDVEKGLKGGGAYGTAGCGLGSLAFGSQRGAIQIIAATLNGTGVQTFAITSGTSNCGDAVVGSNGTKMFIEGNREALAKDAARGSGETIDTLTALAGCGNSKEVGAMLQSRFGELFPARGADEQVSASVMDALRGDASLACKAIS